MIINKKPFKKIILITNTLAIISTTIVLFNNIVYNTPFDRFTIILSYILLIVLSVIVLIDYS
jgi:uncharacterized membrane protein